MTTSERPRIITADGRQFVLVPISDEGPAPISSNVSFTPFNSIEARNGFVRKVYTILTVGLVQRKGEKKNREIGMSFLGSTTLNGNFCLGCQLSAGCTELLVARTMDFVLQLARHLCTYDGYGLLYLIAAEVPM